MKHLTDQATKECAERVREQQAGTTVRQGMGKKWVTNETRHPNEHPKDENPDTTGRRRQSERLHDTNRFTDRYNGTQECRRMRRQML